MLRGTLRLGRLAICLAPFLSIACGPMDRGVGTTSTGDYALTVETSDRFLEVGDETILFLRLRRVDSSNLGNGLEGDIVIVTSVHGKVDRASVEVDVENDTTQEFLARVVFTAESSGVAKVRASYQDATTRVEILIASEET